MFEYKFTIEFEVEFKTDNQTPLFNNSNHMTG